MNWELITDRAKTGARLELHSSSMTGFRTFIYQFGRWNDDFKPCIFLTDTNIHHTPILYATIIPPEVEHGPMVAIRAKVV